MLQCSLVQIQTHPQFFYYYLYYWLVFKYYVLIISKTDFVEASYVLAPQSFPKAFKVGGLQSLSRWRDSRRRKRRRVLSRRFTPQKKMKQKEKKKKLLHQKHFCVFVLDASSLKTADTRVFWSSRWENWWQKSCRDRQWSWMAPVGGVRRADDWDCWSGSLQSIVWRFVQLRQWEWFVSSWPCAYVRSTTRACLVSRIGSRNMQPSRSAPGSAVSHCSATAKHSGESETRLVFAWTWTGNSLQSQ